MASALTLVCVHAHPDDESLFTAGITSHYADLGHRVVLITCTNGQLGFDENARPGSDPTHDVEVTRAARASELQRAATVAGFSRVVTLGYDDSGMKGWAQNGFYGHPDHIMANVVTRAALKLATSPQRLYYPVAPKSVFEEFVTGARAMDVFLPAWILEAGHTVSDDVVSTTMDVRSAAKRKHQAIATHASQVDNADLVTMDEELFTLLFGIEYY